MEDTATAGTCRRRASRKSAFAKQMRAEGYLTCSEITSRVHVHNTTLYRWIREGLVEALDFNGAYYVRWASVVAHLGDVAKALKLTGEIDADMQTERESNAASS